MKPYTFLLLACIPLLLLSACGSHDVVTYSEFRQIRPNMTLAEVEQIIGHKGHLINGERIDGALVATPGKQVYFWQNKDKSNVSVALMNGRVVNTAASQLD